MEKRFSFTRGESLETRLGGISYKEPIRQEVVIQWVTSFPGHVILPPMWPGYEARLHTIVWH